MKQTIAQVLAAGVVVATFTGCGAPTTGSSPSATARPAAESAGEPVPVIDSAPVAGCAGEPASRVPPVEVAARLVEGRVHPAPQRFDVALGAPVVVRVGVDAPVEVHMHGYDRMDDAAPGAPACLAVVADVPGVFEVYAHPVEPAPETLLLQLAVR